MEVHARRLRTPALPGLAALLMLLASLGVAGCGARGVREIHATNVYHHHLSGTAVTTHARYR